MAATNLMSQYIRNGSQQVGGSSNQMAKPQNLNQTQPLQLVLLENAVKRVGGDLQEQRSAGVIEESDVRGPDGTVKQGYFEYANFTDQNILKNAEVESVSDGSKGKKRKLNKKSVNSRRLSSQLSQGMADLKRKPTGDVKSKLAGRKRSTSRQRQQQQQMVPPIAKETLDLIAKME